MIWACSDTAALEELPAPQVSSCFLDLSVITEDPNLLLSSSRFDGVLDGNAHLIDYPDGPERSSKERHLEGLQVRRDDWSYDQMQG